MGIVRAVCTSPAKGTQKTNVKSAEFIEDFGIKEDAHAGDGIVRSVFFPMKRSRRFGQEAGCRWCIWRKSGGRGI